MKIVFLSNFFNHHQKPLSDRLYTLTEGQFHFIAASKVPEERKRLGYGEETPDYVLRLTNPQEREEAHSRIDCADVIISGFVAESLLEKPKRDGKLIFRFSERPLKNGFEPLKYPYRFVAWRRDNPHAANIYLLCAGAYTASDYAAFGMFRHRMFKWGYFPETIRYPDAKALFREKNSAEILWCGRFLDWKHPGDALKATALLLRDNLPFHLSFIGTGAQEAMLRQYVRDNGLEKHVSFMGAMSPNQVRRHMEKAGIFLLTSDKKEGWGAVLNEAMNSACAVIASREAGAVPYLIKDNENGLTFCSGSVGSLYEKLKYLLCSPGEQRRLGSGAYRTILEEWNAETAAGRFIELCGGLMKRKTVLFETGPCSRAETNTEKQVAR